MNGSGQERLKRFLDPGGQWENPLPPAVRRAAEFHFGTLVLAAILLAARTGIGFGALGLGMAGLAWAVGQVRGAAGPASWWSCVVGFTILGIFLCVVTVFAK